MKPEVLFRWMRIASVSLLTGLMILSVAYFCLLQFGIASEPERALALTLERVKTQGAKSDVVHWKTVANDKWDFVCTLPEYKSYEESMAASKLPRSIWGKFVWLVFWNEDDRWFGYFLSRTSGATLPVKVWKTSGWYSEEDEIICVPFERAVLLVQETKLTLQFDKSRDRAGP